MKIFKFISLPFCKKVKSIKIFDGFFIEIFSNLLRDEFLHRFLDDCTS